MIERSPFGRTGHLSSRVIFGAAGIARADQETADQLLPLLRQYGVNHIDTAAMYGDSELRLAPWLEDNRDEFFLATKTHKRSGDEARRSLERSLSRLGVDHVDLIQLHNLVEPDDWETAHGAGGALEAMQKARDEDLVRFIGVTGHGLRIARMHLASLERFDYDSVLLPYSYVLAQDDAYQADVDELLAVCAERGVAVQTIKSVARRRWTTDPGVERRQSWYEPLTDKAAIGRAVQYVLSNQLLFVNSSSALGVLRDMLMGADTAGPAPTDEQLAADSDHFAMTPLFDGGALERI